MEKKRINREEEEKRKNKNKEVPLKCADYKWYLTYSIVRVGINLELYKLIKLKFRDNSLILIPQLSLDNGFVN